MAPNLAFRWRDAEEVAARNPHTRVVDMQAAVAECLATWLFVIIGCGVACGYGASDAASRLVVAFAFGMGILVLAYSVGHLSGGQINCAVTFSLVLGGHLPWYQGLMNTAFQLLGSLLAALVLAILFPCELDMTGNLASNVVGDFDVGRALLGEAIGTFLLCFVVWETAISPRSSAGLNSCLAIGFAVFLAHLILLPIDGCSINPARSFGTAVVSEILRSDCDTFMEGAMEVSNHHVPRNPGDKPSQALWVTWVGPLIGATAAAALKLLFATTKSRATSYEEPSPEPSFGHRDSPVNFIQIQTKKFTATATE